MKAQQITNMTVDENLSRSDSENTVTKNKIKEEKGIHYNKREDSIVIETNTDAELGENFKTTEATRADQTKPTDNNNDDDDYAGLPIDRGWAWVILLACYTNYMLMDGYYKSLGILFVEFLEVLNASVAKTALVFGVIAGVYSISALFSTQVLIDVLKVRKTVILGGFLSFLAVFLGMFATDVTYLICTHSVLLGLGHSMIHAPGLSLLGQYFRKRRGFAMALAMTGVSLGTIVFPIFARYLLDEYGLRGTFLIMAGTQLHIVLGGSLLRPIESFRKRRKTSEPNATHLNTDIEENKNIDNGSCDPSVIKKDECQELSPPVELLHSLSHLPHTRCGQLPADHKERLLHSAKDERTSQMTPRIRTKSMSSRSFVDGLSWSSAILYASCSDVAFGSFVGLNISSQHFGSATLNPEYEDVKGDAKENKCLFYIKKVLSSFDFSLFKKQRFSLLIIAACFGVQMQLTGTYLPALAVEMGAGSTNAALLLTIAGSLDLFSRIFFGYVADIGFIRVSYIMAAALAIMGTAAHFSSFYTSYPLLVLFAVIYGIFGYVYQSLMPVVIIEFVGAENLPKALGFIAVCHGMTLSTTHPILGSLRDMTGTYTTCFHYIGTSAYIAAILLFVESCCHRSSRLDKSDKKEVEVTEPLRTDNEECKSLSSKKA